MDTSAPEYPILLQFTCAVEKSTGMPPNPNEAVDTPEGGQKWPKGVVLGKDGKPCRACTSFAAFKAVKKDVTGKEPTTISKSTPPALETSSLSPPLPADCPPDVEALGRASWTLLHSITATYPSSPSLSQQSDASTFVSVFSRLYPCWVCAEDFQEYIRVNRPRVSNREEFGRWMCEAHNAVNTKLGKKEFDCGKWEERWRTGWKDGRCD